MPRFNLELTDFAFNLVQVATLSTTMFNYSKQVLVPMLTNSVPVSKGEELSLEICLNKNAQGGKKRRFSELQKSKDAVSGKKERD